MPLMPDDMVVQHALSGDELARINRWVLVTSSVRGTVHTVNNILQTISGLAELLGQRSDLPEDARRRIDRIAAQTGRAADIMRELVALGRSAILNPEWPLHAGEPGWEPKRPPITVAELVERGVSEKFAGYLRIWKGFVAD